MKLHKLRVTLSITCGVASVVLIGLWVRSYWRSDYFEGPILWPHGCTFTSMNGRLMFGGVEPDDPITDWDFGSYKFDDPHGPAAFAEFFGPVFAFYPSEEDGAYIHVPHWFLALIFGLIAFVFARRRSYSLRTLLIITTLVAIGLGSIVYYATHANQGGGGGGHGGGLALRFRSHALTDVGNAFLTTADEVCNELAAV
jgi:hypothetical protein